MPNQYKISYLKTKIIPCGLLLLAVCSMAFTPFGNPTANLADLKWLDGTWKNEKEKNEYITWEYSENEIKGRTYNLKKDKEDVLEYITIKAANGSLVITLQATNGKNSAPATYNLLKATDGAVIFANYNLENPEGILLKLVNKDKVVWRQIMSFGGGDNWQAIGEISYNRTNK